MSLKSHFSRFLGAQPRRLNFCAHSHHPWPDVTFEAQARAWTDAAADPMQRWPRVFAELAPATQYHLARQLNLPDPGTICFAANTHEFIVRLLTSIDAQPLRVLTTDGEFHSFQRQIRRLEEAGRCSVETVPIEPFDSFPRRFAAAARGGGHHLVFLSQVFYNSGYWIADLQPLVSAVPSVRTVIVVDGYHGFMAVPTDLSRIAHRVFYLAGGHKYGMAGEGVAFMHAPPGQIPRPLTTGWFAGFDALHRPQDPAVHYPEDGGRFWGATFDPSALYRLNAVMDWIRRYQVTVQALHTQVAGQQREFLDELDRRRHPVLRRGCLLPPMGESRGNFLCFRHRDAATTQRALFEQDVLTDMRGDRLRIGFGIYHDDADLAELLRRIDALA